MPGPLGTSGGSAAGVTSVTAGNGITVTGTTTPTIAASIAAGTGVSIAGTTTLTVSATGVNSIVAGTAISVSGTTTMTVNNTGVTSLAGTGISVSAATGSVTVTPTYAAPTALTIGGTVVTGAAASVANSAHVHAMPGSAIAGASAVGDTAATGTATTVALSDHRHSREAFGTPGAVTGGATAASGSATTLARSDHVHSTASLITTTQTAAQAITSSGAKTATYTALSVSATDTSSTASLTKTGLSVSSTGTWNGTTAVNRGLVVEATGGTANYNAIFKGVAGIGVNTVTPNSWTGYGSITLNGSSGAELDFQINGVNKAAMYNFSGAQETFSFYSWVLAQEMITCDLNNNRIGIGNQFPSYQLQLSADSAAKPTSNSWTISSDARLKTVTGLWARGLNEINLLVPKRYRLNGSYGSVDDGKEHVSVIAQEAQTIIPEMINTYTWTPTKQQTIIARDGTERTAQVVDTDSVPVELFNLDTNALQWTLVNAIKELSAQVESLTARLAVLEAR